MEGVRDYVTVITNIRNKAGERQNSSARHHRTGLADLPRTRRWPPGVPARALRIDQIAVKQIGVRTRRSPRWNCAASPAVPRPSAARIQSLPAGRQPAQGVLRHVRPGRVERGSHRAPLKATDSLLDYAMEATKDLNRSAGCG